MRGIVLGAKARTTLWAALWAAAALSGPLATAAPLGTPLLGQAGAALVPGADTQEAMKQKLPQGAQKMADNFNKAGTGAAAAPPAGGAPPAAGDTATSAALSENIVKYAPSYAMMVLAISLGLFVVCRPPGFSLASLAEKKKTPKK